MKLEKFLASLDGLDEKYHALYEEQKDGTFNLDLQTGPDDAEKLKTKNDALMKESVELKKRLDEIENDKKNRTEEEMLKKQEFEKLLGIKADELSESEKAIASLKEQIKSGMIDAQQSDLASELFGKNASTLSILLRDDFMVTELEDGSFKLQIKDVNGNPSDMTLEQLADRYRNNDKFKEFIVGRDSSGGGSLNNEGSTGGEDVGKYFEIGNKEFSIEQQIKIQKENKQLHDQMVSKYNLNDPLETFYKT